MNLFQIYMLFFGISTVIGVPLLSSFQVTQIKGSTWGDWVSSLGASLGPAAGICVVITIISYIIMKPLLNLIKKAETEEHFWPYNFYIISQKILCRFFSSSFIDLMFFCFANIYLLLKPLFLI